MPIAADFGFYFGVCFDPRGRFGASDFGFELILTMSGRGQEQFFTWAVQMLDHLDRREGCKLNQRTGKQGYTVSFPGRKFNVLNVRRISFSRRKIK